MLSLDGNRRYINNSSVERNTDPLLNESKVRSEKAEERTGLANDRTVLAFQRTSVSTLGISLAIAKIFDIEDGLVIAASTSWMATSFMLAVISILSARNMKYAAEKVFIAIHVTFIVSLILSYAVAMRVSPI